MRFYRAMIALAVSALIAAIAVMGFMVRSKYAINDFNVRLNTALNAAIMVNAEQTRTDADSAVVCAYADRRVVLMPENYRAVSFYLRKNSRMELFDRADRENALIIDICASSRIWVSPTDGGHGIRIRWESPQGSFNMHASGGDIWDDLLTVCLDGTVRDKNIPLP